MPRFISRPWAACCVYAAFILLFGLRLDQAQAQAVSAVVPVTASAADSEYSPAEPGPVLTPELYEQAAKLRTRGNAQAAAALLAPLAASTDADSLYIYGTFAQQAGDYRTAAEVYERAVMIRPEFAGAWVDLASVTRFKGDNATAQALFDYVESEFNPPPAMRERIAMLRTQTLVPTTAPVLANPIGLRGEIRLLAGYDSNANNGLAFSSLPLLIDGVVQDLSIDRSFREKADVAAQASGWVRYGHALDDSGSTRVEGLAAYSQRQNGQLQDFRTRDLLLGATLSRDTELGTFDVHISSQRVDLAGEKLLRSNRSGLGWEHGLGDSCKVGLGIDRENRLYADSNFLDGNITWLQSGLGCAAFVEGVPVQGVLVLRRGDDRARQGTARAMPDGSNAGRAGGNTQRTELTAVLTAEFKPRWVLEGLLSMSMANDQDGYSPLLNNNAPRRTRRIQTRLQLQFPLYGPIDGVIALEHVRQNANIDLFDQRGTSVWTGIRYGF